VRQKIVQSLIGPRLLLASIRGEQGEAEAGIAQAPVAVVRRN
jgi:hypothetical protein